MNAATGTGYVTVTDPDGNTTVDYYVQGSARRRVGPDRRRADDRGGLLPDETAGGTGGGTLENTAISDGNGNVTSYSYDAAGNQTAQAAPDGVGSGTATDHG